MNGKRLLIALGDINHKYYNEAENDNIATNHQNKPFLRPLSIAAMIALALLLVGCTVAYAYSSGWLTRFFMTQSDAPLSSEQLDYIEEQEQMIGQSQTRDGWTVQLKSALNDGRTAYIILGITAPKNVDLESPGTTNYHLSGEFAELISNNRQIKIQSEESGWELDNDGLLNTLDYIIRLEPMEEDGSPEPFGAEVEWNIHIENILCQSMDTDYYQELLNGKYKGQDDIELTDEEINRLYQQEVIAKGIWDFNFTFEQSNNGLELISVPIAVKAYTSKNENKVYEDVIIISFTLNSFSAEICHEADALVTFTNPAKEKIVAVMCDGREIELRHYHTTRDITELKSDVPIVLSEVDHIRMPDGTILSVSQ